MEWIRLLELKHGQNEEGIVKRGTRLLKNGKTSTISSTLKKAIWAKGTIGAFKFFRLDEICPVLLIKRR